MAGKRLTVRQLSLSAYRLDHSRFNTGSCSIPVKDRRLEIPTWVDFSVELVHSIGPKEENLTL